MNYQQSAPDWHPSRCSPKPVRYFGPAAAQPASCCKHVVMGVQKFAPRDAKPKTAPQSAELWMRVQDREDWEVAPPPPACEPAHSCASKGVLIQPLLKPPLPRLPPNHPGHENLIQPQETGGRLQLLPVSGCSSISQICKGRPPPRTL